MLVFPRAIARGAALAALAGLVCAQNRSDWEGEEQYSPAQECQAYDYAPVDAIIDGYPEIWETASLSFSGLLPADLALFRALNASIPDIAPRGTIDGDFDGVTYDDASDPACWWTETGCTTPKVAGLPDDITTCPEPNTWGYTLDDGPNCSHNAFFDYLQSIEQKATLFYIGSNVADWPLEAQRGLADGHEICGHTWSHPYMTSLTNAQAFAELYFTKKILHDVMGITITCWRPPYGDVDDRIRYIANALGLTTVLWDSDTDDWNYINVGISASRRNYENIINGSYTTGGTIVLSHEIDNETMQLSQDFLPAIRDKFTGGVMPVGSCQNWTQIYGEGAAYQYPNYAQWAAGTRSIAIASPTAYTSEVAMASGSIVTSSGLGGGSASSVVTAAAASSAVATSSGSVGGRNTVATATGTAAAGNEAAQTSGTTSGAAGGRWQMGQAWQAGVALLVGVVGGALVLA